MPRQKRWTYVNMRSLVNLILLIPVGNSVGISQGSAVENDECIAQSLALLLSDRTGIPANAIPECHGVPPLLRLGRDASRLPVSQAVASRPICGKILDQPILAPRPVCVKMA